MPWEERTVVMIREEVLALACAPGANLAELCRRMGISRKTLYKWQAVQRRTGRVDDRSRRPHHSPQKTTDAMEQRIVALRDAHPCWGGRKLYHVLRAEGVTDVPRPSTITDVLQRRERIPAPARPVHAWQRFEAPAPNALWQMDFKGHFPAAAGRCHPLTILDDHSRFNLCLAACADEQAATVQANLYAVFSRYGIPDAMLMDNGPPWGASAAESYTHLTAWLIRVGITVLHGRPYHPQTQGKDERFHRTLNDEVVRRRPTWHSLHELQEAFDAWRHVYNTRRPHESLGDAPPASRYVPSPRTMPPVLPSIEYGADDTVRQVRGNGRVKFRGREHFVSTAFSGLPVALRPVDDGVWHVYFCHQRVATIDLMTPVKV